MYVKTYRLIDYFICMAQLINGQYKDPSHKKETYFLVNIRIME